ncbi:hypothetical protein Aduo_010132 [Ancylostoma duodenale]
MGNLDRLLFVGVLLIIARSINSMENCDDAPTEAIKLTCKQIGRWDENTKDLPVTLAVRSGGPRTPRSAYECLDISCLCKFFKGTRMFNKCLIGTKTLGRTIRKEYRVMSEGERLRFHGAMWKIKLSGEYDRITRVHSSFELSPGAHSGPAFLPWHREFTKRLEIALRQIDPTIGLPYWDYTLDQVLPDSTMSVLWSDELMGRPDSDGQVRRGAFKNWTILDGSRYFRRNIGARGQLMTQSEIERVVTAPDISLLLSFTAPQRHCAKAGDWSALEYIHGGPHVYTGGDMGVIPTATHDPIFFLHHGMIDFIWEEWRTTRQSKTERETAYPENDEACSSAAHFANTTMTPFWPMVNIDGLSNKYTDNLYQYAPRPTCSRSKPNGCGSKYLFCDLSHGQPRCASKIMLGGRCNGYGSNEQPCYNGKCVKGVCVTTSETPTQPETPAEEKCFNEDQCCGPWAARGECSRNPSFMLNSCKASCGVCIPKTYDLNKGCSNRHKNCARMASNGDCQSKTSWMYENCRRACKMCRRKVRC